MSPLSAYGYHRFGKRVIVASHYDCFVFVVMVRHLFVFERFKQAKYIRSEIINQINCQYAAELESNVL